MKKLLLLSLTILACGFLLPTLADAQLLKTTKPAKDSVVNTDNTTITLGVMPGDALSFHATGTKASGTIAGKVYLDVSIDGSTYYVKDSVTLSDGSAFLASFERPYLYYSAYRLRVSSTGTVKITGIRAHYLRRSK